MTQYTPTRSLDECTDAFAVPGQASIIDLVHPDTGRSMAVGETLAEIRVRYPGAAVVPFSAWLAATAARQRTPVAWTPCTISRYEAMLTVLPPADYERGGFLVGEPADHDADTGQPRFAAFRRQGAACCESNRPMTRAEFRAAMTQP